MTTSTHQYELTMEEILASIRKMVGEETDGVPAPGGESQEVDGKRIPATNRGPRRTAISQVVRLRDTFGRRRPPLT
jgi:cell pole-organizing protein PopZ